MDDDMNNYLDQYKRRKSAVDRRARESAELFPIKEDLAAWLAKLTGLDVTAHNFMDVLDNGVILCKLVKRVQETCQQRIDEGVLEPEVLLGSYSCRLPLTVVKCHSTADKRSFYARDNVSKFIAFARALGVQEAILFESNGLVNQEQPKEVVLTLLDFARRAARYGIEPPDLVTLENEIDKEEAATAEEHLIVQQEEPVIPDGPPEDEVDRLVRDIIKRVGYQYPIRRLAEGRYCVEPGRTKIFVRVLRAHIMVRVGGGWTTLEYFLVKHTPSQVKLTNYGSANHVQKTLGIDLDEPDKSGPQSQEISSESITRQQPNRLSKRKASTATSTTKSSNPPTPAPQKVSQQKSSGKLFGTKHMTPRVADIHVSQRKKSVTAQGDTKMPKSRQPLCLDSEIENSPYLRTSHRKASGSTHYPAVPKTQVKRTSRISSE